MQDKVDVHEEERTGPRVVAEGRGNRGLRGRSVQHGKNAVVLLCCLPAAGWSLLISDFRLLIANLGLMRHVRAAEVPGNQPGTIVKICRGRRQKIKSRLRLCRATIHGTVTCRRAERDRRASFSSAQSQSSGKEFGLQCDKLVTVDAVPGFPGISEDTKNETFEGDAAA